MATISLQRDRFLRLSVRRRDQAKDLLRLIGNMSSHAYEWKPEEVTAMFDDIRQAVDSAESRFRMAKQWPDKHPAKQFILS